MIVITGALGFIGSCLVSKLGEKGHERICVVDDFYKDYKKANLNNKPFIIGEWVHRDIFIQWFKNNYASVDFVYHLGARTDTTETNKTIFKELNFQYSKEIWKICTQHQIPLVYASSAATYGDGKNGYSDSHSVVKKLKPLNAYGDSKNDFDKWVLEQKTAPPFWAGLKFFNVYGPNEYHKRRMASVIFHAYKQIKDTGEMKLFRSHKRGIKDGHQKRDFVYVMDVVNVCHFFLKNHKTSGLFNLGTGKARTFLDLVNATFKAMGQKSNISYIDTPKDIRKNYQYFTEAKMTKLKKAGYKAKFTTLENGVKDYVKNYLDKGKIY